MSSNDAKTHYCVISHTHWDREWYQPLEELRFRLVDLIDHLLEIYETYPDYTFHLDAQTVVLEDYLEIRPHQRERLAQLIRDRRILVGPWYVQNDFALTSGEATVRNLLEGSALAREFGYCATVGYAPDQFGLISQLPQILQGFGIDNCVFGRGYNRFEKDPDGRVRGVPTPTEFRWTGADDSQVLAVLMRNWYNNAQRFSSDPERARKYLSLIDAGLRPYAQTPCFLLMNGVDHLEAQEDLLPILETLNAGLENAEIHQASFEDYIASVRDSLAGKDMHEVKGELRYGMDGQLLQGTFSSRIYLKQANVRSQALLENRIEPVYSILAAAGDRVTEYPADYLHYLWKSLIKNHPHDSICGCSRDEVHANMEDRFARIEQCGNRVLNRGLKALSDRIERSELDPSQYLLTVVNTGSVTRSETVTATLRFPKEDGIKAIRLLSPAGTQVPFEIVRCRPRNFSMFSPINLPGQTVVDEVVVRFVAEDVPGLGYTAYVIDPCSGAEGTPLTPMDAPSVSAGAPTVLENEFLRATVQADGRIDLLDKTSGQEVTDAVDLVDEADAGHSYLFMRLDGDRPRVLSKDTAPAVEWLDNGIYSRALQVSYRVSLPADLAARRGTATEDQQVEMPIRLTLRLDTGSPRLDVQVDLDNRVSNHRLRLVVHSDVQTDESLSSAPFDLVTRNRVSDHNGILHDPVQPNSGMITVQAEGRGMSLFTDGLYEYEHLMGERGSLALTLVRGTGVISHNEGGRSAEYADLPQPREWLCPGNQCLRPLSLRLAILPGPRDPVWLQNRFLEFLVPMMPYFDSVNESKFSGGRPCVQDSEVQETFYRPIPVEQRHLPRQTQAFAVEGDSVVLSAVKRAEDGKRWILRVYNPTDQAGEARVRVNGDQAWILRLDETPVQELAPVDGTVTVTVPGKGITTIGCTH